MKRRAPDQTQPDQMDEVKTPLLTLVITVCLVRKRVDKKQVMKKEVKMCQIHLLEQRNHLQTPQNHFLFLPLQQCFPQIYFPCDRVERPFIS